MGIRTQLVFRVLICENEPQPVFLPAAVGHADLLRTDRYYSSWIVLLYNEEADARAQGLRKLRRRIGTHDLRIAAIALLNGFTLVTSNRRDFSQLPGLMIKDWIVVQSSPD